MARMDRPLASRTLGVHGTAVRAVEADGAPGAAAGANGQAASADDDGRASPLDRDALRAEAVHARAALGRARRLHQGIGTLLPAGIAFLMGIANTWRPVRVWTLYTRRRGPLMAAGSAYHMFFSIAAMLVVGFSIFGLIASGNKDLQDAVVSSVARTVPGLIDTGGGGLATPDALFASKGFGWALVVSTATMLVTSLNWISGLRQGMRGVFGLHPEQINPVLAKARDLGVLAVLGVLLVVTTLVGLLAGAALGFVVDLLGIESRYAIPLTRTAGIVVMLVLDVGVSIILFRFASGIRMPRPVLLQSALLAAVGSTVLRYFSSALLGSVDRNPLLAPFAVILGLFVWFFLLSQVYLVSAAWAAVGAADARARNAKPTGTEAMSLRRRSALIGEADS